MDSSVSPAPPSVIRDQVGNMGYATTEYWVGLTTESTEETKSYAYDAAGCLTNLNGISLEWDERYRLMEVSLAEAQSTQSVSYAYDVLGRRVSRAAAGSAALTEHYVYEGNQIAADLDGSGNPLRTYTWGAPSHGEDDVAGIDNLLSFTDHTTSKTYYAIKDHQNSVLALVDEAGAVVESYEYDAYGNTTIFDASGSELTESFIGNRHMFQGREYDAATGLYYFRARWYNPDTGRWLSKDPIGIAGGLNQYEFCNSNPVNFIDPMGLWGWSWDGFDVDIIGIVVGAIISTVSVPAGIIVGVAIASLDNITVDPIDSLPTNDEGYIQYNTGEYDPRYWGGDSDDS